MAGSEDRRSWISGDTPMRGVFSLNANENKQKSKGECENRVRHYGSDGQFGERGGR